MLLSPHQPSCKFKEICNVLEIIKLLAIHAGIRFGEPTAYVCLYHAYQSLLGIGFQQFVVLILTHNILCYFNILAINIAS